LSPHSQIVEIGNPSRVVINDAREPMLSADGQSLAFVRDDRGRGRLMVRTAFQSTATNQAALTPSSLNIYEASFLSKNEYAFSAVEGRHPPQIFLTDAAHLNTPLALGESRYPALSTDGRWMAYSRLDRGVWNLWLRNQRTGLTRRIADEPCNQIQPAWEGDSKTLLYSTDCGRNLWFTAVSRRRVIP
jgi:Tol biopolymer transport system component